MEPSAVLVRPFEIQIRREAGFRLVRAAQHGEMRGPRVEPDIEGVAALVVARRSIGEGGFFADGLPGFDAAALDALRNLLEQVRGARMQLSGLTMQEKG